MARGQQRSLVHQVGEVGAGEAGCAAGDHIEVDARRQRLAAGVDGEDRLAALEIGPVDDDLAVEATGTEQRRDRGCRGGSCSRGGSHPASGRSRPSPRAAGSESARARRDHRRDPRHGDGRRRRSRRRRRSPARRPSPARTGRARRDAPTPTNISTKSEPLIEKNGTPASPATALASSVLPVPGGPNRRTPLGIFAPIWRNFPGDARNSLISSSSSTASSSPATSPKVTVGRSLDNTLARDLPKPMTFVPPPCTWPSTHSSTSASSANGRRLSSRLIHAALRLVVGLGCRRRRRATSCWVSVRRCSWQGTTLRTRCRRRACR